MAKEMQRGVVGVSRGIDEFVAKYKAGTLEGDPTCWYGARVPLCPNDPTFAVGSYDDAHGGRLALMCIDCLVHAVNDGEHEMFDQMRRLPAKGKH